VTRWAVAERPPPVRHGTVSATSAHRFAARVRSRRRRTWSLGIGGVALVLLLGWVLLGSPWLVTRTVQVSGTTRVDAALLARFGEPELGRPLLLARTGAVQRRALGLELVTSASVSRQWPGTLRIRVQERSPVAAVPGAGGVRLVDPDGVVVQTVARAPARLPLLRLDTDAALGGPAVRACLQVLDGLPASLRDRVRQIGATSPDGVWLLLGDSVRVQWGGADQTPLKARVLRAMLPRRAAEYDVSAPHAPAFRGAR
jgi:cell division protein FtsQ